MSVREMRLRRVSGSQLELLWEFLNENRNIAAAFNRSLAAKSFAETKWKDLADQLNAQGDGAHKDWKAWSKYWVDYKAKLKKKAAFMVSTNKRTGGGPPMQPLSLIDAKFLELLGPDFGQGLPGVRVEPFPQHSVNSSTGSSTQMSSASESILNPLLEVQLQEITPLLSPTIITTATTIITSAQTTFITSTPATTITTTTPAQNVLTAATPARSPRRRRRRREPPMSQEAARRALVQSSQMRAEATLSSSRALETIGRSLTDISRTMSNIENVLQRVSKDIRRLKKKKT